MNTNATLTQGGLQESRVSIEAMETSMAGFERTTLADLLTQQEALITQSKEASQIDDASARAAALEIINSSMEQLGTKIDQYREDTAELVAGLEAQFEKLGLDLSALQKPTQEDLQIVVRAESHLGSLKTDGPVARSLLVDAIADAMSGLNPFGKAARILEAENKLTEFDIQHRQDVADAEAAIVEAKAEVERLRRKRIREAEFDSQFERFITMAQQIQAKLLENVTSSEVRMGETLKSLQDALKQKEALAKQLSGVGDEIRKAEDIVMALEQERKNAVDEVARSGVDSRLGAANQKLAELSGTQQEMQVAFNSFESAATKHEKMMASLQVQRDNQRAHARKLSIDSKARFSHAQNLVVIIQNTAQEDAASKLHTAGSSLDRTGLEIAARALIASERERIAMHKGHEKDMQDFAKTSAALAEGRAQIAIEDAEIADRMKKNYGIDPLGSSWLHIAEGLS
jgi:hypothetical protein